MLAWAQQHPNLLSLAWDHQAYLHLFVLSLLLIYPPHSQRSLQASPPSIKQLAAVLPRECKTKEQIDLPAPIMQSCFQGLH
jgi:hypothetical protein